MISSASDSVHMRLCDFTSLCTVLGGHVIRRRPDGLFQPSRSSQTKSVLSPLTGPPAKFCIGNKLVGLLRDTEQPVQGALKMREWKMQKWKMREHIAEAENAGVEIAGATMYGKPSEKNTLQCQTKYGCCGFHAHLLPNATHKRVVCMS